MVPNLKKSDYVYNYGSEGTTFIFQDIVAHYYNPIGDSVTYHKNGKNTVYLSHDVVRNMDKEGTERTVEKTKEVIVTLTALVAQVQKEIPVFQAKDILTKEDVIAMFEKMGRVCRLYEYFDYRYWDVAFKESETNTSAQELVDLVQNFKNVIRTELNPIFFDKEGYLPTTIEKLSQQFGISQSDLEWHTEKELLDLFDGKKIQDNTISDRKSGHIFVNTSSGYEIYQGSEAEELIKVFDTPEVVTEVIKGMVAHGKGKIITGTVFVMNRNYASPQAMQEEMNKMNQGEILVSETTDPDLMPVLAKASAVITDTGGLLSHAAITARELNIACIVGTGIASKILKNGDTVEIDTNTGIITVKK